MYLSYSIRARICGKSTGSFKRRLRKGTDIDGVQHKFPLDPFSLIVVVAHKRTSTPQSTGLVQPAEALFKARSELRAFRKKGHERGGFV